MPIRVFVGDDAVDVRLDGWDMVWSFCGHLRLPMSDVVSARVAAVAELRRDLSWRLWGTWLPGVVLAGTFAYRGRAGERQFWCVYRDPEVLVIETRRTRPRRVVLQHPDRDQLAWWIGERVP